MSDLWVKKMLTHLENSISKSLELLSKNEWGEVRRTLKDELKRVENVLTYIRAKD